MIQLPEEDIKYKIYEGEECIKFGPANTEWVALNSKEEMEERGGPTGRPQIASRHILLRFVLFTLELPEGRPRRLPRRRILPAEPEAGEGEPAAIYRPDHSD